MHPSGLFWQTTHAEIRHVSGPVIYCFNQKKATCPQQDGKPTVKHVWYFLSWQWRWPNRGGDSRMEVTQQWGLHQKLRHSGSGQPDCTQIYVQCLTCITSHWCFHNWTMKERRLSKETCKDMSKKCVGCFLFLFFLFFFLQSWIALGSDCRCTGGLLESRHRFSLMVGDLGAFPSSLQVSKVGWPQLHLSKLNWMLMTFPVEPVHTL